MTTDRRIFATFDLAPSVAPPGTRPDELMIDWTNLPSGSTASLYLPGVAADDILGVSARLYGYQPFRKVDNATVTCAARGISYMPMPKSSGNLAGLLEVVLPGKLSAGHRYTVAVRQLSRQSARAPVRGTGSVALLLDVPPPSTTIAWRKVAGAFKLAIHVRGERETLAATERNLSLLRWIFPSIPADSRWRPIFVRYLEGLAEQVSALGGDAARIPASPTGGKPPRPDCDGDGSSRPGHTGHPEPVQRHGEHGVFGKVDGLVFDHFGDFEGFILETEAADRLHFYSRERNLKDVVERAWAERLRVAVYVHDEDEHRPRRIVLYPAPRPI